MASMREQMPTVAAWIDDLRLAFGRQDVTLWVRHGIAEGTFHAKEGVHELGAAVSSANAVHAGQIVLCIPEPEVTGNKRRKS